MEMYGYCRVSSKDQNEARQLTALHSFGVKKENIFIDKQSGKDFEREGYKKLLKKLRRGSTLVVSSIDRLGRNYEEILEQWRILTKSRGIYMVVLDMPLLDTRSEKQDLTGVFISDLVLQILCYVAQVERENIRRRQTEGIAAAKKKGVRFGRKRKEIPPAFFELQKLYREGKISARGAARELGIAHSTFIKWNQR